MKLLDAVTVMTFRNRSTRSHDNTTGPWHHLLCCCCHIMEYDSMWFQNASWSWAEIAQSILLTANYFMTRVEFVADRSRDLLFNIMRPNQLLANGYHMPPSQKQSGPSMKQTHKPPYNTDVRGCGIVWPALVCLHGIVPNSVTQGYSIYFLLLLEPLRPAL